MKALIAAKGLRVTTGGESILEDIDLAVYPEEIVTVIGPNGSGKTTLLQALMGLTQAGGIVARNRNLRIGYVPQSFPRDPCLPMKVVDFLKLFVPEAAGLAALERTGVDYALDKQVNVLSGGELARVLLARAIARKPNLLVLDEPTASVDLAGEAALYHLIGAIRDELGCGVLLVSHDLHVVMAKSTRVVCLNHNIRCEGAADKVVQDPAFRELFGERAAAETALYAHHHHDKRDISCETEPDHG